MSQWYFSCLAVHISVIAEMSEIVISNGVLSLTVDYSVSQVFN